MILKNRRTSLAFASLFALQAFGNSCATQPPQATPLAQVSEGGAKSQTPTDSRDLARPANAADQSSLTDGIRDGLTGLLLEDNARQESLHRQAREFIAIQNGKLNKNTRRKRVQACQEDEPRDAYDAVFCRLTLKVVGASRKAPKARASRSGKDAHQLAKSLRNARIEDFANVTDSQVISALKKIDEPSSIQPMINRVLDKSKCASTALITGLGLKSEENFPDPKWKETSEALYARSSECGTDASAIKAGYRLGLLRVWNGKYDLAEEAFARIADSPEATDFRSRVLYWRYFCAKQRGDTALRDQLKATLSKDHPMSLHGLVTSGPSALATLAPRVAFRSLLKPSLDATVRVAEALQSEGARMASVDALQPILEQAKGAEPEFQLYLGLLLTRAGDTLNKFKLLSGLFRDYPGVVAQESLELLFPLHRFEMVRVHEGRADPYLVISLIRQESAFNDRARSRVGAMGLMQLMPQTARRMERVTKRELFDPKTNIRLGVRFFSYLIARYGGDVEMALAAYNAGPEKVDVWKARYPVENRLLFVDLIPYRETREYVASIARNYFFYKKLYTSQAGVTAVAADTGTVENFKAGRGPASPAPEKEQIPAADKQPSPFKLFDT